MTTDATPVFVVVGSRPWNRRHFEEVISRYPGEWHFVATRAELTLETLRGLAPRYVFFLHWSWIVPAEIVQEFECVCFHMTDVPYGRGGSPLQNLIQRGHRETRLTALRMSEAVDAGPVYLKEPLSLEGGAEEIYLRAGWLSARMIERIIQEQPEPQPQEGEVVPFRRRTPGESELRDVESLEALHDFIRMLDAEGYPHAFVDYGPFRLEFTRSALYGDHVQADVRITRRDES